MEEELRIVEERARDDSKPGCVTSHHPRVPDGEANDSGNEQPDVGYKPERCGTAAETVHTRLGPLIHWLLGGSMFSRVRNQDKFMDYPGQEDEGLDASQM